ncbi:MAG: cytochrome c oxidase subunit 4 [Marinoscillum sp.]|jgi:cytochrome c oxidase subunit 4
MEHHTSEIEVQVIPEDKAKTKKILKVAIILGILTAIEFVIAFTISGGLFKTTIFILMTLVKAYYIVSEFMHLGHERKSLIWSIILPTMFIFFFIFIMIYQGAAIFELLY